ncbi:MAG: DNA-binding protein [Nanoarchaeota archaeon]|nr:DNA-binding protein [Nanoarchaeota archaeon]MBU1850661.1 DNA-binding protein [Nanoarchaeota archaeon]
MNINKLFEDKKYLEKELNFFITKNQIKKISKNEELVISHLKKAKHNLEFFKLNKQHQKFNDWLIVTLYYSLYHCALALITNKRYTSKNHYATILILIKEYSISRAEAELLKELSINKEDAELYTNLKGDRHNASYLTQSRFNQETIQDYENQVLDFINKTEELIQN